MIRRFLFMFVACLALVAASCSTGGGDDDAGDGEATTTEANGGEDETTTTEPGDDETTTTTEGTDGGGTTGGGGGTGGGSRQAYVDAMVESLLSDDDTFPVTEAQARCVGESWVDIFDPERLAAAGITPEDIASDSDDDENDFSDLGLSESEAGGLIDTFGDCGVDLTRAMVDSIEEEQPLTAEDRACLENAFNEDFLRRVFVITLTQGEEALEEDPQLMGEMMGALFSCPGAMGLSEGDL